MKYLITAARDPNATTPPTMNDDLFAAYMRFNEELANAGVLVASEGLNPAKSGAQVVRQGDRRVVVDGPYAETKELVGGFYVLDVKSLDEAVAWALKCPVGMGADDVLTIHPLTEAGDIPPEYVQKIREVAPKFSRMFEAKKTL